MRESIFILTMCLSFASFAADCLGKFCVGSTVIDDNDRVGKISKIQDNTIIYYASGYNREASESDLNLKVSDFKGIQTNSTVIDEQKSLKTVK